MKAKSVADIKSSLILWDTSIINNVSIRPEGWTTPSLTIYIKASIELHKFLTVLSNIQDSECFIHFLTDVLFFILRLHDLTHYDNPLCCKLSFFTVQCFLQLLSMSGITQTGAVLTVNIHDTPHYQMTIPLWSYPKYLHLKLTILNMPITPWNDVCQFHFIEQSRQTSQNKQPRTLVFYRVRLGLPSWAATSMSCFIFRVIVEKKAIRLNICCVQI